MLLLKDSARSVGEELDYDDDHDIMSTGRPTPRISLSSRTDTSKLETPKTETPKSSKTRLPKQEENAKRGEKGNMLDDCTANKVTISSLHDGIDKYSGGDGKRKFGKDRKNSIAKSKELKANIAESKETEAGYPKDNVLDERNCIEEEDKIENRKDNNRSLGEGQDVLGNRTKREAMTETVDKKQELNKKTVKDEKTGSQQPEGEPETPKSPIGLMDIFKASTEDKMTPRQMLDYDDALNIQNNEMSISQMEKKPPIGKESGNQVTVKTEEEKAIDSENRLARSSRSASKP